MSYGRAVQMEHTERLEACKLASIFVLFSTARINDDGQRQKKVGEGRSGRMERRWAHAR